MEYLSCGTVSALLMTVFVGLLVIIIAGLAQQGRRLKELCAHGVEASAIVERNEWSGGLKVGEHISTASPSANRGRDLGYRYTDAAGVQHTGTYSIPASLASDYAHLALGDVLPIVYSSRRPRESAPKRLVDQFRPAFKGRA